ncbi:MAG TPA: RNA-binding protein [Symbiobacteriaceae bacterium]|nr:RNA-binding protein [Symbiobacteriaceae bacterium]
MTMTLYVGNLPWSLSEEDLQRAFAAHVPVKSARVIRDRETGRSRGFGFVEVENEYGQKAIAALNGAVLGGRPLIVNEAQPRSGR